ncbi:hypothetical protein DFH28DRAFT_1221610 [Melampsora americana]|nr:hypothetical protein DFH28DRAFT_1221610 [Melampsora americana]
MCQIDTSARESPMPFLSEQSEIDISDGFEFEDIEVEEGVPSNSGFTIPSSLKQTEFKLMISEPSLSAPLHRRIIELRRGIESNSSQRKKQKTKLKMIKHKQDRNRTRLSPLSQTFSSNQDSLISCDEVVPSVPLFVPNLRAFTSLNNPHSKSQTFTKHSIHDPKSKSLVGSQPTSSSIDLSSTSYSNVEISHQKNSSHSKSHIFNVESLSQLNSKKSSKRKNRMDSNDQTSNKRHCQRSKGSQPSKSFNPHLFQPF